MLREDSKDVKGKSAIVMPVSPKKLTWYQDYDRDLNFVTDAWKSPNMSLFWFTWNGRVNCSMILDLVEVNTLPDCSQLLC